MIQLNYALLVLTGLFGGGAADKTAVLAPPAQVSRREPLAAVVINELVSRGEALLSDEDGDYPDWIELKNDWVLPVDLEDWSLTDDAALPEKWVFPSLSLEPGERIIIFASDKDRAVAGSELHANFKLKGGGEYLGLARPGGQIVSEFARQFPALGEDEAYGRPSDVGVPARLAHATPFGENSAEQLPAVGFAPPGGVFPSDVTVTLEALGLPAGAAIHFTVDGSDPDVSQPEYGSPIRLSTTARIRARVIGAGGELGPGIEATYTVLHADVLDFQSDLPLVIVDTLGANVPNSADDAMAPAVVTVIERDGNQTELTDTFGFSGHAGIRVRGASSAGFAKKQYKLELWDSDDKDLDAELLDLGAESDWVLYAPGRFDRAMVNNPVMYTLAKDIGHAAMDVRFCELYLNDDGGSVRADDYDGIYVLMESVKAGAGRIDVDIVGPGDVLEPEVGGSYIFAVDTLDSGQHSFWTSSGFPDHPNPIALNIVKPNLAELQSAQIAWVETYFETFESALYGPDFEDPLLGYQPFIEEGSFIDHTLLRLLAKETDTYRKSNYFYRAANGRLVSAPVWDFDRALESDWWVDDDPKEIYSASASVVNPFGWGWWGRFHEDAAYRDATRLRWWELRQGLVSRSALFGRIDGFADEIEYAYPREEARWGATSGYGSRFGDLQGEIEHMQAWLDERLPFLDRFFQHFQEPNLAIGSTASQSSTDGGNAGLAVDGELGGVFGNGSVSETQAELEPYWEVDLGSVESLGFVRVWNRTDAESRLLGGAHVLVSADPFSSASLADALAQPGVSVWTLLTAIDVFADVTVARPGRYVRIQLPGVTTLRLAEVQILGTRNVALLSSVSQSSTVATHSAERAVDGVFFGASDSASETQVELEPWWELVLDEEQELDSIRLWSETGGVGGTPHILVSSQPFQSSDLATSLAQPGVTSFLATSPAAGSVFAEIDRAGRYIRVQLPGRAALKIAEAELLVK